jgi:predicted Zn-dependent protease
MRRWVLVSALTVAAVALTTSVTAQREGVTVRHPSLVRNLISAEKIENTAEQQYSALKSQAASRRALVPESNPQMQRIQRISKHLLPHALIWNARAKDWHWDVILINSQTINAFCMPGGKIAVFTGIIEQLQLSDDEIALVLGHEIAHALREHARARAAKSALTNVGAVTIGILMGGGVGHLAQQGGGLLVLKFSRDDEKEADLIGMELAARAGYNPSAGISLWEKMSQAARGPRQPQWLSTHPSSATRITLIKDHLKEVLPLYEKARAQQGQKAN